MVDVMEIDIDRPEKVVYVVGLGPGEPFYMTQQAANTLESVDAICGYKVYLDLIRDEFPCEEYYSTGMTQEIDRCRWALEKASTGKRVALVCSGDAGVYGMASPLLELTPDYPDVAVDSRARTDRCPQRRGGAGCTAGTRFLRYFPFRPADPVGGH